MKSWFNFKNLIKRAPNTKIPIEFIGFGIGLTLVVLLGLIAGNMHLQEQLFFEGVEKSTPMFTEEELRMYGEYYRELEIDFQNRVANYIQNYANRTNRRGDNIKWGVYGQNNSDDLKNDDFVDGVTIRYAKTEGHNDGDSNFQDILGAVAILADQSQSRNEEVVKNYIKELFEMSHTFTGNSSGLYKCTHGCFCDYYHCSDANNTPPFSHCNIKYQPFPITYHDEYEDYPNEEDFEIVNIIGECEVCKAKSLPCYKQRGCQQNGTCYHGDEEKHSLGDSEPTPEECTNWSPIPDCDYDGDGDHDCSDSPIGCAGYYQCNGHEHYECPDGHFYVCCMGHTNVTINIKIMYLAEIIDVIKNGYDIGDD